ncbi:hypothetical protein ACOSP7_026865 [Xanthoceras sorbifolium]
MYKHGHWAEDLKIWSFFCKTHSSGTIKRDPSLKKQAKTKSRLIFNKRDGKLYLSKELHFRFKNKGILHIAVSYYIKSLAERNISLYINNSSTCRYTPAHTN